MIVERKVLPFSMCVKSVVWYATCVCWNTKKAVCLQYPAWSCSHDANFAPCDNIAVFVGGSWWWWLFVCCMQISMVSYTAWVTIIYLLLRRLTTITADGLRWSSIKRSFNSNEIEIKWIQLQWLWLITPIALKSQGHFQSVDTRNRNIFCTFLNKYWNNFRERKSFFILSGIFISSQLHKTFL